MNTPQHMLNLCEIRRSYSNFTLLVVGYKILILLALSDKSTSQEKVNIASDYIMKSEAMLNTSIISQEVISSMKKTSLKKLFSSLAEEYKTNSTSEERETFLLCYAAKIVRTPRTRAQAKIRIKYFNIIKTIFNIDTNVRTIRPVALNSLINEFNFDEVMN
jgi:hypothetical protein